MITKYVHLKTYFRFKYWAVSNQAGQEALKIMFTFSLVVGYFADNE